MIRQLFFLCLLLMLSGLTRKAIGETQPPGAISLAGQGKTHFVSGEQAPVAVRLSNDSEKNLRGLIRVSLMKSNPDSGAEKAGEPLGSAENNVFVQAGGLSQSEVLLTIPRGVVEKHSVWLVAEWFPGDKKVRFSDQRRATVSPPLEKEALEGIDISLIGQGGEAYRFLDDHGARMVSRSEETASTIMVLPPGERLTTGTMNRIRRHCERAGIALLFNRTIAESRFLDGVEIIKSHGGHEELFAQVAEMEDIRDPNGSRPAMEEAFRLSTGSGWRVLLQGEPDSDEASAAAVAFRRIGGGRLILSQVEMGKRLDPDSSIADPGIQRLVMRLVSQRGLSSLE